MEYSPFWILQRACFIDGDRVMRSQAVSTQVSEIFPNVSPVTYTLRAGYLSPQEELRRECSTSIAPGHLDAL